MGSRIQRSVVPHSVCRRSVVGTRSFGWSRRDIQSPKPPPERYGPRLVRYTTRPCAIAFECWLQPAKLPRGYLSSRSKLGPVFFPLALHLSKKLATCFLVIFFREGRVENLNRRQSVKIFNPAFSEEDHQKAS